MTIAVPRITRANQGRAMALGYVAFSVVYLGSAAVRWREPTLLAGSVIDTAIPLLGWSVWVYLTQFLLLPTAIVSACDDDDRARTLYAMLVATALAALVFVVWPTRLDRHVEHGAGLTAIAWSALYLADTPANCLPSLHVALATIAGTALWRRGWRITGLVWPALIALSTLTTKQHVAWDVVAGCALGIVAWHLTPKLIRHERSHPSRHTASA